MNSNCGLKCLKNVLACSTFLFALRWIENSSSYINCLKFLGNALKRYGVTKPVACLILKENIDLGINTVRILIFKILIVNVFSLGMRKNNNERINN